MNTTEYIDELNSRAMLRLAPSPIHGVGVFAARDIMRGSKVYADNAPVIYRFSPSNFKKLSTMVQQLILEHWPRAALGEAFTYADSRMLAYMNHSDEPNYDAKSDLALTDIKEGEELTEDYRQIEGYAQAFPWLANGKIPA